MKRSSLILAPLAALLLFSGCVASIGNHPSPANSSATLGQQLIDLQKAKDTGVITDAEYQEQRERFLRHK